MKMHFIGIGGIGTSALAQYYLKKGHQVSGSDLVASETSDILEKLGAKIIIGLHAGKNIPSSVERVIHSPAVQVNNPEIIEAKKRGLTIESYPEALGLLTREYFTIAVSGTHGKSTTTALIALILIKAGLDPTVIIGTTLREFGDSNCRVGEGKYLVIEADEWNASFLHYWPKIIVLTNIEEEHLDYYEDLEHILNTYKEYVGHLPKEGKLIVNGDDENIAKLDLQTEQYSLRQKEAAELKRILQVPGEHNVYNALAALAAARAVTIPDEVSFEAVEEYQGAWRRFEIIEKERFTIISDYAHHPTEIAATLKATREKFPDKKILCIFQPHQYQRTRYLFDAFVKVFSSRDVDEVIITDIYDVAGREKRDSSQKVSAQKLVAAIKKPWVRYIPHNQLKDLHVPDSSVLIVMGAGDIYKLVYEFSTGR